MSAGFPVGSGERGHVAEHDQHAREDRTEEAQQNAEKTSFPDGHFDLIVSHVLLHETSGKAVRNILRDIAYAGVMVMSGLNGQIIGNAVSNIVQPTGFTNSYGIAMSRDSTVDFATAPRSRNCAVIGNTIERRAVTPGGRALGA